MTYYTILILAYMVDEEFIQTKYVLRSMRDCDHLIRIIVEPTQELYPQATAHCIRTDVMTPIVRPRMRPAPIPVG